MNSQQLTRGLTLVELIVAMTLLVVTAVATLSFLPNILSTNRTAGAEQQVVGAAQRYLERVRTSWVPTSKASSTDISNHRNYFDANKLYIAGNTTQYDYNNSTILQAPSGFNCTSSISNVLSTTVNPITVIVKRVTYTCTPSSTLTKVGTLNFSLEVPRP